MASVDEVTAGAAARTNGATSDIPVENPATGEIVARVPDMSAAEVAELARKGRAAQPGWEALGYQGRGRVLRRMQKWILENADEVIDVLHSETGKSREDAMIADIAYTGMALGFWAKKAPEYLADEKVTTASPLVKGKKLSVRYAPLGLVGVIGPWNYPIANSFGDAIPALAAGNSVILKPSEITPLTSLKLEEALRDCGLPEGVFQVATGRGETGAALVDEADMVMFTGSTATGKRIMARAAETLTPVSLELGGKDPLIVCADADLDRAANLAVFYSMFNCGQTCISVERVYVEEPVYEEFLDKVVAKAKSLRQGTQTGWGTVDVGSMTFPPQVETVERHVEDAKAKGARVLVGGRRGHEDQGGHWYEPTVLVDVDHTMDCMMEETFGPTLPIMKVADTEEAIKMANDSPYGLSASVYTRNLKRGKAIARRIEAGVVNVNDTIINYTALELPMGGWKASGLGTRHGANGIKKYCKQQVILVSRFHRKNEVHMYPYKASRSKLLLRAFRLLYARGKRD